MLYYLTVFGVCVKHVWKGICCNVALVVHIQKRIKSIELKALAETLLHIHSQIPVNP